MAALQPVVNGAQPRNIPLRKKAVWMPASQALMGFTGHAFRRMAEYDDVGVPLSWLQLYESIVILSSAVNPGNELRPRTRSTAKRTTGVNCCLPHI